MRKINVFSASCLSIFLLIQMISITAAAQIRLPRLITDHMVLQQQSRINLWGWAKPGERITITTSWNNKTVVAITDPEGK
jgi:sialate O-acetylesterase